MKRFYLLVLILSVLATACKKGKVTPEPIGPVVPVIPIPPVDPVVPLPTAAKDGVVFINNGTSAIITLYAPYKKSVAIIAEFNNWQATAMKNTSDGNIWWIQVDNLNPDTEYAYQFLVDGSLKIADPYCEKILDPANDSYIDTYPGLKAYPTGKTTGIVSVMQGNRSAYNWKHTSGFTRPAKNNLVIYELLIRDFTAEHNYASTLQKLDYLVGLGINAIELMPVNEFEGNLSWGYNPSFYFAPDKYYGTKAALQNFIDECHGKGIAVILDMVLNHSFGQSPMVQLYFDQPSGKPLAISPWFNTRSDTHPYNVGYDFNHESTATKIFAKNVMKFWMQEYKIDGFRFDLSKGFTQKVSTDDASFSAYDASRVAIWNDYNNHIKSIDANNFYVILEHFADAAEEKILADAGMMLWNGLNVNMNEATMGWVSNSDFSWAFFARHGFARSENLINFIESHDEERTMYKNLNYGNVTASYSVKNLATALKREEMAATFLFAVPGPKMIWQFEELGYDISINYNGRTGNKPIHWEYFQQTERKALYDTYAKLIGLKKKNAIFNATNASYNLSGGIKYVKLVEGSNTVMVVGNFDVTDKDASIDFGTSGLWYDVLSGGTITLGTAIYNKTLAAGEYHVYSRTPLNGG